MGNLVRSFNPTLLRVLFCSNRSNDTPQVLRIKDKYKDKLYPPPIRKSPADFLHKQKKPSDASIGRESESPRDNFFVSRSSREAAAGTHVRLQRRERKTEGLALLRDVVVCG